MKKIKKRKQKNTPREETRIHSLSQKLEYEEKKKASEAKKQNDREHRNRVNSASGKRAFPTAFTKGYYRFSREYPSTVSENGDRLNEAPRHERPTSAGIIALVAVLLLAFCVSFTVTDTAIGISERGNTPQTEAPTEPDASASQSIHAVKLSLEGATADSLAALCKNNGCNAVCLDYKDDYGYIGFVSRAGAGDSARNAVLNASDTVTALHEQGISVIMRVSCFLDTCASNANYSWAALTGENGRIWYDSQSSAWLNPYSQSVADYLTNVVSEASASGADYILLDNVCFSPQTKSGGAYYPGESTSSLTPNSVLRQFISVARTASEHSRIILCCRIQGLTGNYGENYSFYAGNMLETEAPLTACDLRLSAQTPSLKIGTAFFERAGDIPYVFVLTASEYAVSALGGGSSLFAVLEKSATTANELNAVSAAGIENYIITD